MRTLIVEKDGTLSVREVPLPEYNECQALVKTVSCGICNGTDAKLIHGRFKFFGPERYPLMLGHEGVGRVVAVGKKVTSYRIGDIVLLPFTDPEAGLDSGWGAFSEYGVVCDKDAWDADKYGEMPECAYAQTVVPEDIDPVDAAMIVTLREVLSSIRRFGIRPGKGIAVFGCGPVGLTFIRFMHMLGIGPITALDIVPEKLESAKALGADYAFDSNGSDLTEKLREIYPDGLPYILDAVGRTELINRAMPLLCDQGKICCYGISPETSALIDWSLAPYNWTLQFQQFPSKKEEGEATGQILAWLREGKISLKDYISDYFAFDDILTAFDRLAKREISGKGIVVYKE